MANDLVTVFRSADEEAQDQAAGIADLLKSEGIDSTVFDDGAPGVPEGAFEVRVQPADVSRAESLINARAVEVPNESHDLDLVTVFQSADGSSEEAETMTVKNLLEAAGIEAVLVGGGVPIPSLGQEVRVRRDQAEEARRLIVEARASGPAAADEAEAETEASS